MTAPFHMVASLVGVLVEAYATLEESAQVQTEFRAGHKLVVWMLLLLRTKEERDLMLRSIARL